MPTKIIYSQAGMGGMTHAMVAEDVTEVNNRISDAEGSGDRFIIFTKSDTQKEFSIEAKRIISFSDEG